MKAAVLSLFASLLLLLVACGDDDARVEDDFIILEAEDFQFRGTNLFVGSNVRSLKVANTGSVEHNFTIDELEISESLPVGETTEIGLPQEPGFYIFYCSFHEDQDMRGTLSIEASR